MPQFLNELIGDISAELRQFYEDNLRVQDPTTRFENQLRIMYARGEISKELFTDLRRKLHWGQIMGGEIKRLHQEAVRRMEAQGKLTARHANREITRSLDRLYLDLVLVQEARSQMEEGQQALLHEATWIKEQAESARRNAQSALPDEGEARAYLEIWQNMLELSRVLNDRIQALSNNLRRFDGLEAEMKAYIAELKLLESQEHLTELNLHIHEDYLALGQKR